MHCVDIHLVKHVEHIRENASVFYKVLSPRAAVREISTVLINLSSEAIIHEEQVSELKKKCLLRDLSYIPIALEAVSLTGNSCLL